MKRGVALSAAGIVLSAGLLAPTGAGRPGLTHLRAAAPASILGFVRDREGARPALARLDPETLKALAGRRVRVVDKVAPSLSPDRTRIVLGNAAVGSLTFVDIRRMRLLGYLWASPDGPVAATAWPRPRRVLAAVVRYRLRPAYSICCARVTVFVVDPSTRKVLRGRRVAADPLGFGRWRGGLVMLLGPVGRIGAARLAVVDGSGRIRSVRLSRISAGRSEVRRRLPGVAVDPARARAFVVSAGEPVAEVDLRTLAVKYHELTLERTPSVRTKDIAAGPAREARWLGNGLIAVSGSDLRSAPQSFEFKPAGLTIVDTATWKARTIDGGVSSFWFGAQTLLSEEPLTSPAARPFRFALVGWALDGRLRLALFPGRHVERVETARGRAYVSFQAANGEPRSYSVVELGSGEVTAELGGVMPELVE